MKKFIYFLAAIIGLSTSSCKDDDVVFNNVEDLDRMPMTMFRKHDNTNVSDETDKFASKVKDGTLNTIELHWYGINGAAGYEIRYAKGLQNANEETWSDPSRIVDRFTVGPDVLTYELRHLSYSTDYRFQIRVLHPDGKEEHHSKWYGMGGGQEWEDYMSIPTKKRYKTPGVVSIADRDRTSFNVYIDLNYDPSKYKENAVRKEIESNFEIVDVDGDRRFVADKLVVSAHSVNPMAKLPDMYTDYSLDNVTFDKGKAIIHVEGLDENAVYTVSLKNSNKIVSEDGVQYDVDAFYNYVLPRTKGDAGDPIVIQHYVDPNDTIPGAVQYEACRIDTIIANYNSDISLAENQVFYLQGDKAYYIQSNQDITKGFTLETLPEDVLLGKRAIVYLDGMSYNGEAPKTCNWNLGKQMTDDDIDAPLQIGNLIFRNIDFDSPLAHNFGHGSTRNGNYVFNTYKEGLGVEFESLQVINCTFQHFSRGFFRAQGGTKKVFNKMVIDGNLFYNMGWYDANGGYAWINGQGQNEEACIFADVTFTNNTIYGAPLRALIRDDGKEIDYERPWNIKIENNTFINFGTLSKNIKYFDLKSIPGGTYISFKRNLIVQAYADDDKRNTHSAGATFQKTQGSGLSTLDFAENYSAGCRPEHMKDDGILTANKFSAIKFQDFTPGLVGDKEDTKIKVGSTPLLSTELFVNPNYPVKCINDNEAVELNPLTFTAPNDIFNALKYRDTPDVKNHEIYTKNIGDQRWKSSNPRFYYSGQ